LEHWAARPQAAQLAEAERLQLDSLLPVQAA
jgi:hypothetical protein